jgi:hypothetical protein
MGMNDKIKLELRNVKFDRSRFRRYLGNISEMIVEEVLLQKGFEVWTFVPYFPDTSPFKKKKLARGGLIYSLNFACGRDKDNTLQFDEGEREKIVNQLKAFFGEEKLKSFIRYMKDLGVIGKKKRVYCPDLVAKKDDKIYIIEVKTQKALRYLKKEWDWLMLAKEYGFSPVVATVDVKIEARDLVLEEL